MGEFDLRAACDSLRAEPLFHMSLGSKELFHSNFLNWLFLSFPQPTIKAFSMIPGILVPVDQPHSESRVLREYRRFDLALLLAGYRPTVIENKMFSVPRRDQLIEYQHAVQGDRALVQANLCLLSPLKPAWLGRDELAAWMYLGYRELIDALQAQIEAVRAADQFAAEILERYCAMTATILQVVEHFAVGLDGTERFNLPADTDGALDAIRLRDGVVKLRADAIAAMIEERLRAQGLGDRLYVAAGFTRKKPLIEVFQMNGSDIRGPKNPTNRVGWQLQENQWRMAMILPELAGKGPEARIRRTEFARRHRSWFDFSPLESALGSLTRGRRSGAPADGFNVFDPHFVYDYRSAPGITVGQIVDVGIEYARRAAAFQLG